MELWGQKKVPGNLFASLTFLNNPFLLIIIPGKTFFQQIRKIKEA